MGTTVGHPIASRIRNTMLQNSAYAPPTTLYFALYTVTPVLSTASMGTEVSGGNYSRVAKTCNMTNFSGTQGKNTTAVSSGTSGTIYNNNDIVFPTPSADWGTIVAVGVLDHPTNATWNELWFLSPHNPASLFVGAGSPFILVSGQWSVGLT